MKIMRKIRVKTNIFVVKHDMARRFQQESLASGVDLWNYQTKMCDIGVLQNQHDVRKLQVLQRNPSR